MASYHQYGGELPENANNCPNCGAASQPGDVDSQMSSIEASAQMSEGVSHVPAQISRDVRNMAVLCHLSAFAGAMPPFLLLLGNILGPLMVWLLRRKDSPFVDIHGRQAVNFQISMTIYLIASVAIALTEAVPVLLTMMIAFLLWPAMVVFGIVMVIRAALRANDGIEYSYPLAIPFLTETPLRARFLTLRQALDESINRRKQMLLVRGLALSGAIAVLGLMIMGLVDWEAGFFIAFAGFVAAAVIIILGVVHPLSRRFVSIKVVTRLLSALIRQDSKSLLILVLGIGVAGLMSIPSNRNVVYIIILLVLTYLMLQFATRPLSRLIARIGWSIRWKLEVATVVIAILFLSVGLITFGAMEFMHDELHKIQEIGPSRPAQILRAVDALEDTNHGPFFTLMPFLSALGVVVSATLGAAMAWSVISPVRRIEHAMAGIASGEFSQSVQVDNRDELGELANRTNQTGQELARLHEETIADERARALRERIAQVILAQEEERRRISRELHDGLGPSLAAIGNRLRSCQYILYTDPDRVEGELEDVTDTLKGHIQEIRELIHDLRPLVLDQLGLVDAIRQHVERFGGETGTRITFSSSGEVALNPLVEVTLFRIIQECLNNVRKHAEANEVEVGLKVMETAIEVAIEDDGQGFDPNAVTPSAIGGGVGLLSMQERAELVGGRLSVQSSPGSGCRVFLHIPL